jgi:type IX secretion system PorP/SprF family membrane protein
MKYCFLFSFILYTVVTAAQQDPQYTQYMYNMAVLNPAYAGSKVHWSMGLLYRNQWTGLDGAPQTGTLFAHKAISDNWGIGGSLIYDTAGPVAETNTYADLAYTIKFDEERRLAFGLKLGATFHDIGLSNLIVFDPDDPFFSENVSSVTPNFGAGLFYYTSRFYAGFSVPNMLKTTFLNIDGARLGSQTQHYFLTAGMVFNLSQAMDLKPSFLLKSAFGAPVSLDLNLNARLNNRLELGISYRTDDSLSGLLSVQVSNTLRVGYAYDYVTSEINPFGASSSEIILLLDLLPGEKRIKSPRFF